MRVLLADELVRVGNFGGGRSERAPLDYLNGATPPMMIAVVMNAVAEL